MISIPLTNGGVALIDDDDERLLVFKWFSVSPKKSKTTYARRAFWKSGKTVVVPLHREIMGCAVGDGKIVDHINGNGLDNRKSNLRIVSHTENMRNRHGLPRNNTSGHPGVHMIKGKYWVARIGGGKFRKHVGCFSTFEDAVYARAQAEAMQGKPND